MASKAERRWPVTDALAHIRELIERNPDLKAEYERLGPRWEAIKEILRARDRAGISNSELARRMGVSQAVVSRLLSGEHSPRLDTVAAAAKALGCRIEIRLVQEGAAGKQEAAVAEEAGRYASAAKRVAKRETAGGRASGESGEPRRRAPR